MVDSLLTCVTDTNIWIDLDVGRLLTEFFHLPFNLLAPDVIVAELKKPPGNYLISLGLELREFTGEQLLEIIVLGERYPAPSRTDLFALVLARGLSAVLLTGDKHLRKAAEREKVTVYGTLWVLDQLIKQKIITPYRASEALKNMLAGGRRLPVIECNNRLKRWAGRSTREEF